MSDVSSLSCLRLLTLSNGHGEDAIAVRILQELKKQPHAPEIFALPLVGEGHAYQKLDIPLIASVRTMPSGGFIHMDKQQLLRDVQGGLLQLTCSQIKAVRSWVKAQKRSGIGKVAILAVGDIIPLAFAWMSGAEYAFVGTAKSEYYVRDEDGLLARQHKTARWENFSGSVYHPWERWLMSQRRCKAVFPRDSLTAKILKQWSSIPVFDLGNSMMDGLEASFSGAKPELKLTQPLIVTLLPGSRPPEAYTNWQKILLAVSALIAAFQEESNFQSAVACRTLVFLGAIAPQLQLETIQHILRSYNFYPHPQFPIPIGDSQALTFKQNNAYCLLTQSAYNDCLHWGDLAIAMAGTATEQFVGLGKPAITIPGEGPQFTPAFAEAQSRLLGKSVILVERPQEVGQVVRSLFAHQEKLQAIAENGLRRMGKPGAARRIAECLSKQWG